ncbi:Ger(x)C family spore germination protein [Fictibacillus barbaricus]|uniref:Ger(X)C family spore germination protein n=1 Tax=Fictibacillus barbaricus TaxID=182136 RepID=A0ABS2ZEF5_9BACL|nr:Ger(x)C family spore germination protein [Fictibacillus barbaricus]MBN3546330.1 Ger(x)C family spore germination protein [Fictibacillus barbaricus]GGB40223.1 germination protein [Fictibacillus barbaricus]
MKKKIIFFLIISIIVAYFGRVEKEILDELEIATSAGFDYKGDQKVEATAVFPRINPDKTITNETLSTTANLSKEALREINQKSHKPIENGKLEVAVYNEKLARHGIEDFIDTFHRDPSIGSRLILAVVDGSSKKILEKSYGEFDTGTYLQKLLEHNMAHGIIPTSNFHLFLSAFYARGMDPILPLLELNGNNINIKGLALFKGPKMVMELTEEKLFTFKSLYEELRLAGVKLKTKENNETEYFSIQAINSKKKFKITNVYTDPEINIHLKVTGSIREYSGENVDATTIKKAEKLLKKKISKESAEMIKRFQKKRIDPLGLGEQVRSRTRHWDEKKWEEQYKNAKINVKVEVIITEIGVVDGLS